MMINRIRNLRKDEQLKNKIKRRLEEFSSFKDKENGEWFSELCFCILTANSKAVTAISIQDELGAEGFLNLSREKISEAIRRNRHRFHNNKSKFIIEARQYSDIKDQLRKFNDNKEKREWIADNIKGLGFKEASHFLRNTGHFDLAVLDRHILNILSEEEYLREIPKTLSKKTYLQIEKKLEKICGELKISQAELDLYLWFEKTGKVLK
ncbi:MAG: N-glycosylase/DNA lyase [Nanobdellota archaeon]